MTPSNKKIKIVLGEKKFKVNIFKNYDDLILNFLSDLSKIIFEEKNIKIYPDLLSFAFWIRKSNLLANKNKNIKANSLGLGLAFHVPPSNIPLNFAYSLVFGMIGGNSNIVRIPSKENPQSEILINSLKKILKKKKYLNIKKSLLLVKYDHDDEINKFYSKICDCRLIWGGDSTIQIFKNYETKPTNLDILFPDKYSLSIINSDKLVKLRKQDINTLIKNFYNDTYLFDQNACTSPHLILWFGRNIKSGKTLFWNNLHKYLKKKYEYNNYVSIRKYSTLLKLLLKLNKIEKLNNLSNLLYVAELNKLPSNIDEFKGYAGIFFEFNIKNLNSLSGILNRRFQTLLYHGFEKKKLLDILINNKFRGIDRIVPIGRGLDMNFLWDGYRLDKVLSREIEIL